MRPRRVPEVAQSGANCSRMVRTSPVLFSEFRPIEV
jgi:hypothetical protein